MNSSSKDTLKKKLDNFFTKVIWDIDKENVPGFSRFIRSKLQLIFLVIKGFINDKCTQNSASLAFATLLTIIPLFAIMFPILKIFDAENNIRSIIADKLAAGNQEVASRIFTLIDSINFKILGFAGIVFLFFIIVLIISNVEHTINDIWGIKKSRNIFRKITDFLSILVIVPLFVFISTGITAYLQSHWYVQKLMSWTYVERLFGLLLRMSPFFSVWVAFTFFYLFIPNTKVRFKPALIAGIVAGTLWQFAHWAFINSGVIVERYDLIYGSFSKLPIFMLWIFYSWVIVLFGAEISFACQNLKTYRLENLSESVSFAYMQQLALNIIITIADSYYHNKDPWSPQNLSEKFSASRRLVNEILFRLVEEGFLVEVFKPNRAYIPAFDIENMSVYDIIHKFQYKSMADETMLKKLLINKKLKELSENSLKALKDAFKDVTVKALIT